MGFVNLELLVVGVALVLVLGSSIRIVRDDERFVTFTLGRFAGLKGPGLILVMPGLQTGYRIRRPSEGTVIDEGWATFRGNPIPYTSTVLHIVR